MGRPFKSVDVYTPKRSVFDLSYQKLMTGDMGILYPILCDEVVPGDKFKLGHEMVIRMMPLVSPVLHPIKAYIHTFFVPYRLLWPDWEKFITGGVTGDETAVLPRWNPGERNHGEETLWDYLGFPASVAPTDAYPLDFPRRAYAFIWNNFYRDETFQTELDITSNSVDTMLKRNWSKDYFTSALPWQQRGTAPALPISGHVLSSAVWDAEIFSHLYYNNESGHIVGSNSGGTTNLQMHNNSTDASTGDVLAHISNIDLNNNEVDIDLSEGTTFNVADIRLAFQIQKFLERNARAGARYTEFLHAHFGVAPRDERLQRPEYIGGMVADLIVSEVLQTSQTTTTGDDASPQGNMAGHGITAAKDFTGEYFATEYGLIMSLLSIMPVPMYSQGINRQWLRRTKYDFYFPEFANLSEQAIEKAEIMASNDGTTNRALFGYQGRYDEMRYKPNMVCGKMRSDFAHWHLARHFDSVPSLNSDFLECVPDKRIFAVPSEPGFIISVGNLIKATRPIPISSEPGLIDHH